MTRITILKLDHQGRETYQYEGELIHRQEHAVVVEAYFDREDTPVDGLVLRKGDRFVETYYSDRWYNVFEVHAHDDDHLRGWYCNITRPAIIAEKVICYDDLALDLLIFPDGRQIVLDIEEFAALDIPEVQRASAWDALKSLQAHFKARQGGTN